MPVVYLAKVVALEGRCVPAYHLHIYLIQIGRLHHHRGHNTGPPRCAHVCLNTTEEEVLGRLHGGRIALLVDGETGTGRVEGRIPTCHLPIMRERGERGEIPLVGRGRGETRIVGTGSLLLVDGWSANVPRT